MKEHREMMAVILSVISILLVLSMGIVLIVFNTYRELSSNDLSNFYSSFIALCTTFIVGFQIYQAIDYKRRLEQLAQEKRQLEELFHKERKAFNEKIGELDMSMSESMYFNAYSIAMIRFKDPEKPYYWNALRAFCNALKYASVGGHDFNEALSSFGNKMDECMDAIKKGEGNVPSNEACELLADEIYGSHNEIKRNLLKNDSCLFVKYMKLMRKWEDYYVSRS